MSVGENIRALRRGRGLTQASLAWDLGVTPATVSEWERDQNYPRADTLQRMADLFRVSPKMILEGIDESFRAFTTSTSAPLYGTVAAGEPLDEIPVEDRLWAPPDLLDKHPNAFYLKVDGESMNRVLPNGCYALIDPFLEPRSGDLAALNVNGYNATIKRVLIGTTSITLVPSSFDPSFVDQVFDLTRPDTDEVMVIGKVVWYMPPYDAVVTL